jgi:hypothetical protein
LLERCKRQSIDTHHGATLFAAGLVLDRTEGNSAWRFARSQGREAPAEDEGPTGSAPLLSNCCQTLVGATAG